MSSKQSDSVEQGEPVAKNENGSITWLVDNWPQNCLLYTHPQQRTWVKPHEWRGLTDEENEEIQKLSTSYGQAIELTTTKLKEKNT